MQLTKEEEKIISGESGEALASAYRILLAIGNATEATKLIPIKWAHLSGVNYNTVGDAGVEFLEKFSTEVKVKVKTTLNPMGFDRNKPGDMSDYFVKQQMSIIKSYHSMGATPSFTCIPYEIFEIPVKKSAVSFAESSAAIFSNSILGLLTNKESALSALASSVTGKAPYSDLRVAELRNPKATIKPDFKLMTELDYGLLGYFGGKTVKESCVAFDGIEKIIARRVNTNAIGFNVNKNEQDAQRSNLLRFITAQDLKSFGLIPELLGRLPVVTHLDPLDAQTLRSILTEPKNSLIKQYTRLFAFEGIELHVEEAVLDFMVQKALEYKLGARGLRSICEHILTDAMFELPGSGIKKLDVNLEYASQKISKSKLSMLKVA